MPYIAGLDFHDILRRSPISHGQGMEGMVWLTTFAAFFRGFRHARRVHKQSQRNRLFTPTSALTGADANTGIAPPAGGNIGGHVPRPLLVKVLQPVVHGAFILVPVVYLVGTAFGKFEQPEWFTQFELPWPNLTVGKFAMLKTAACVAHIAIGSYLNSVRKAIFDAEDAEKKTFPDQGPYSVVRHPLSVGTVLSQATLAVMWWNTIPLATMAVTGLYMAIYAPYEERKHENDLIYGTQYTEYKKRVAYKFIPGIW